VSQEDDEAIFAYTDSATDEGCLPTIFGSGADIVITGGVDANEVTVTLSEVGAIVTRKGPPNLRNRGRELRELTISHGICTGYCRGSQKCMIDPDCPEATNPDIVEVARHAVAAILFKIGDGWYSCTGESINSANFIDGPIFFVTANHCISEQTSAETMEAWWHFWDECEDPWNLGRPNPDVRGGDIIAMSPQTDFTLIELPNSPPPGTWALRYDANYEVANGESLYRIHHPNFDPQMYSEHEVDYNGPECWPHGNFIYSKDILGSTWGGSSGSPVVNSNGNFVGQLTGACGLKVNKPCEVESVWTVDGSFYQSYHGNEAVRNALGSDSVGPALVGGGGYCGDGIIDGGEVCDGENLGGEDCTSLGFDGGELACDIDCTFDTSGCTRSCNCGSYGNNKPTCQRACGGGKCCWNQRTKVCSQKTGSTCPARARKTGIVKGGKRKNGGRRQRRQSP